MLILQQRCSRNGDLRELDDHHERCEHRIKNESCVTISTEVAVEKLMEQVDQCEIALQDKDKQIALLEFMLHQHPLDGYRRLFCHENEVRRSANNSATSTSGEAIASNCHTILVTFKNYIVI